MEIDDGSGSGSGLNPPKRRSEYEVDMEEYRMKVRATDALLKEKADRDRQDRLNRMNMTKRQIIQQELFFCFDIDLNRISLKPKINKFKNTKHKIKTHMMCPRPETTPPAPAPTSQWGLVSDNQMMQPAPPAGGAISPVPCFPNKD